RRLRDTGMLVVLITHKLGEALDVCDAATVMRGGAVVRTVTMRDTSARELAALMIGANDAATVAAADTAFTLPPTDSGRRHTPARVTGGALVVRALSTAPP